MPGFDGWIGSQEAIITLVMFPITGGAIWLARRIITKPRVRLALDTTHTNGERHLMCHFFNDPLSTWPFGWLNIKKQNIDEFTTMNSIVSLDTGQGWEVNAVLHDRHGVHVDAPPLPASTFGVYCAVVSCDDIGASLYEENTGTRIYLYPGAYELQVLIHADEVDVRVMAMRFAVGVPGSGIFEWIAQPYRVSPTRFSVIL